MKGKRLHQCMVMVGATTAAGSLRQLCKRNHRCLFTKCKKQWSLKSAMDLEGSCASRQVQTELLAVPRIKNYNGRSGVRINAAN